ncbi:MAG: glycosyltransferase family 9 protein [Bdellovibrionota bacterium]
MIASAGFLLIQGPLIAIQAGASQGKRQWAPDRFVRLIRILIDKHNARIVLTGTKKELSIIQPIKDSLNSENVFVAAGKTNIPQLTALLAQSDLLVTGDTGPMHISVAAGTPVVAMFLASAYCFETGPYSAGNIVLQPMVQCCPCNPNRPCARPDCHEQIDPEMMADLVIRRIKEDFTSLPQGYADPSKVVVYRSAFDKFGFCNFIPLTSDENDPWRVYRDAYRDVWLDDLAGYDLSIKEPSADDIAKIEGLGNVLEGARKGVSLIDELCLLVKDTNSSAAELGRVNKALVELDREIEQTGYHYPYLGPLTRLFIFDKENITGTDALLLASQMRVHYQALERRGKKLAFCYSSRVI